jgi:two-component system, LytTR family, sensor kinase
MGSLWGMVPSKTRLILLTATAITVLITLPRILLLQRLSQGYSSATNLSDLLLRAAYIFITSVLFFLFHLHTRTITIGFIKIDGNNFWHRLPVSIMLFIIIDSLLLRFHTLLFRPHISEQLFRFLFNINMVITVIITMLFAQVFRLLLNNYQMRLANASLLKTNAETRFEVLKNQVNPHFLFNSLNTINSLIVTDQQAAVNYVNNMSDVYRYVLKSHELNSITLEEELCFIKAYTHMLKGRYGTKMHIDCSIQLLYSQYQLPPMALQILVENAVKHNVASHNKPLCIRIYTSETGVLVVENNLQKRTGGAPSTGVGLQNLNLRCKYLSNRHLIIQQTETSFSVTVPLMNV